MLQGILFTYYLFQTEVITLLSQLLKQKHNKPKTQFFNKLHWSDIILISIHLPWLSIVPNIILEIKLH